MLDSPSKKTDQLKTNQPLAITDNNRDNPAKKEAILLAKIKLLENQLKQTTTERDNLKQLLHQEKQRANQLEIKLKAVGKFLYQLHKINHYQQLEKEQKAQIEQPPLKPPNK